MKKMNIIFRIISVIVLIIVVFFIFSCGYNPEVNELEFLGKKYIEIEQTSERNDAFVSVQKGIKKSLVNELSYMYFNEGIGKSSWINFDEYCPNYTNLGFIEGENINFDDFKVDINKSGVFYRVRFSKKIENNISDFDVGLLFFDVIIKNSIKIHSQSMMMRPYEKGTHRCQTGHRYVGWSNVDVDTQEVSKKDIKVLPRLFVKAELLNKNDYKFYKNSISKEERWNLNISKYKKGICIVICNQKHGFIEYLDYYESYEAWYVNDYVTLVENGKCDIKFQRKDMDFCTDIYFIPIKE